MLGGHRYLHLHILVLSYQRQFRDRAPERGQERVRRWGMDHPASTGRTYFVDSRPHGWMWRGKQPRAALLRSVRPS